MKHLPLCRLECAQKNGVTLLMKLRSFFWLVEVIVVSVGVARVSVGRVVVGLIEKHKHKQDEKPKLQ